MKNAGRRKRRNSPSGTNRHSSTRAVHALAAGLAIAALGSGTGAYADPIRFDNPPGAGHFVWVPSPPADEKYLDVVLPPGEQPDVMGQTTLGQIVHPTDTMVAGMGSALQVQVGGLYDAFVQGVDAGTLIPSGFLWGDYGYIYHESFPDELPLPPDEPTYLGVSFDLGQGTQYGWIGVVMEPAGHTLDAFAWGYETVPGEPIPAGIPEPGTLAALALGAAALLATRRRVRSQID